MPEGWVANMTSLEWTLWLFKNQIYTDIYVCMYMYIHTWYFLALLRSNNASVTSVSHFPNVTLWLRKLDQLGKVVDSKPGVKNAEDRPEYWKHIGVNMKLTHVGQSGITKALKLIVMDITEILNKNLWIHGDINEWVNTELVIL